MNYRIRNLLIGSIGYLLSIGTVCAQGAGVSQIDRSTNREKIVENTQDVRKITGVILDVNSKEPLIGATIYDPVSKNSTIANSEGKFVISVADETKEIVVTYIGYETASISVNQKKDIKVLMAEVSSMLGEVVVTGLQTIERGRATGSYNIITPADMGNIYSTNISEKLEGAAPGLYVDKDNNLTIRGLGSINATTQPLIVVDGFPLESSQLNLNPNDIEQISVLKDAASASIWGVRAANGVVVITTKRGKRGKVNVSYTGAMTSSARPDWKDLHILSSDQYVDLKFQSLLDQGISNSAYGGLTELEQIYSQYNKGTISLDNAWGQVKTLGQFNNEHQITNNFYRKAFTQQHNVSISAGSDKVSTYVSLNYDENRTSLVGDEYNKFNVLLNNDFKLHRTLSLAVGLRGTYLSENNNGIDMTGYEPWKRILNDDGSYYNEYNGISEDWQSACVSLGMQDWHKNTLEMLRMNDNRTKEYNLSSSLRLNWTPIEGLEFTIQGNYEFGNSNRNNFYSQNHYITRDLTNRFTELEIEDAQPTSIIANHLPTSGGIKNIGETHLSSYSIRDMVSYRNSYKDIDYKVLLGNEVYSIEGSQYSNWLWGFNPDLLTSQSINLKELQEGVYGYNGRIQTLDETYSTTYKETLQRYVSWFGTADLSYHNTYDLFASARLDQTNMLVNSSKFRNNPSWSVGAKWNINKESFFKVDWVNSLALRLSYGLSGNIDKSTGPDIVAVAETDYNIPSLNYLTVTNPENSELGWEKTYTWNVGVDYILFNNRISGGLDFYRKLSKGLLANVDLDPTSGWSQIYKNSATVRNYGLDFSILAHILSFKDFKWDASMNISYNKNKVTEINYQPSRKGACKGNPMKGQPLGYIAVHRYGGLDENGEPTFMKKGDDTKYSYDEMSLLTLDDLEFVGSTNPPVFGSFSTSFTYKDFTLSAMLTFRFGNKIRLPNPSPSDGLYTEWMSEDYRWVDGADNSNKWVPRFYSESDWVPQNRIDCLLFSDQMVDDGDVIYFKSINLIYDLSKYLRKIGLNGGSVKIGGENLGYWAANKFNLDPDQLVSGLNSYESVCSLGKTPRLVVGASINF